MQAVEKQTMLVAPTTQTIKRVTKQKNSDKVRAGQLGAKIRTHNLRQKLLNDLQGKRVEETPKPPPAESTTTGLWLA